MPALAVDTALGACAVAVVEEGAVLAAATEPLQRGHAERLAPMVQEVMTRANLAFDAVDRVIVTTGPGSFTGVRVGLAFARAFTLALGVPCIGVSTLEALALERGESGWRGAKLAAPKGVYVALYHDGAPVMAPALQEDEAELAAALARYPEAEWATAAAPDIVAFAARGMRLDPALYPPRPLYLRAPDAKPAAIMAAPA